MTDYATLLRDHLTLNIRCIDRVFLQGYVPQLQTVGYVCRFLRWQRNFPIPSSAAFGKIGQQYVRAIHRFAEEHNIPRLKFEKGQDKEKIALPYLESAAREGQDRVVLIGWAQAKASIWKSWPRKGQEKAAHPHMDWGTDGLHRSFLLLLVGSGVGWELLQDQRLCSFSHLALAQRP